jgi:RNA polymerase sigma-70 factor (ECF subfamily)
VLRRDGVRLPTGSEPDLSGDEGLRQAWAQHAGELYGYARRALADPAAAEEAVQETFLRAWRSSQRYDPARPLRPWLFAILRNVVVDEARSRRHRAVPVAWEPAADDDPAGDDVLSGVLDGWLVEEALRRLSPDHRTVLVETYLGGRSYTDVARQLGIPEGTARSRAFYALRALRLALEEMGWVP